MEKKTERERERKEVSYVRKMTFHERRSIDCPVVLSRLPLQYEFLAKVAELCSGECQPLFREVLHQLLSVELGVAIELQHCAVWVEVIMLLKLLHSKNNQIKQ